MEAEQIRVNAERAIKYQSKLAASGKDFSAADIMEAERLRDVVAGVAENLTEEERERIAAEYAKPTRDKRAVKDIKEKYGLSWSELEIVARTCEAKTPQARYDARMARQISLKFNRGTDADILEKLASVQNIQGYIKALIRADIRG